MRNLFRRIQVSSKGFTLIELLIVIAIIGALAAGILVAINPLEKIAKAKDSTKKAAISQLVNALQSYYVLKGGQYPEANNAWITALVNNGDLKNVPSPVPYSCAIQQNGYCYKLSSDGAEAVVYASLETSERPSGTSGTTPYFLWSSASGESGIYYSVSTDITGTSGFTFGPSSTLTQGLVGWWKMDEDAADASGSGNNGTVIGATLTTGKSGQAYSFNGTSDYMTFSGVLNTAGTVSLWVKWLRSSVGYGGAQSLFANFVYQHSANNYFYTHSWSGAYVYFAYAIPLDTWTHLVFTWTNSSDLSTSKLYADNVLYGPNPGGRGYGSIVGLSGLANGGAFGNNYLNAVIDDVRIYNRALSDVEITALYQSY